MGVPVEGEEREGNSSSTRSRLADTAVRIIETLAVEDVKL